MPGRWRSPCRARPMRCASWSSLTFPRRATSRTGSRRAARESAWRSWRPKRQRGRGRAPARAVRLRLRRRGGRVCARWLAPLRRASSGGVPSLRRPRPLGDECLRGVLALARGPVRPRPRCPAGTRVRRRPRGPRDTPALGVASRESPRGLAAGEGDVRGLPGPCGSRDARAAPDLCALPRKGARSGDPPGGHRP